MLHWPLVMLRSWCFAGEPHMDGEPGDLRFIIRQVKWASLIRVCQSTFFFLSLQMLDIVCRKSQFPTWKLTVTHVLWFYVQLGLIIIEYNNIIPIQQHLLQHFTRAVTLCVCVIFSWVGNSKIFCSKMFMNVTSVHKVIGFVWFSDHFACHSWMRRVNPLSTASYFPWLSLKLGVGHRSRNEMKLCALS